MSEPSKLPIADKEAQREGRWKRMNAHRRQSPDNRKKAKLLSERQAADRAKRGVNEGLNAKEIATLAKVEGGAKTKRKTEQAVIVDSNGNVLLKKNGGKSDVNFTYTEAQLMKDAVITHNHPSGVRGDIGTGMGSRIGTAVNAVDVATAMRYDAKEIRATTQGYIFSVKRPKGGWKGDPDDLLKDYYALRSKLSTTTSGSSNNKYLYSPKITAYQRNVRLGRVNATLVNGIMTQLAKKYGFTYTRRRM